MVKVQLLNDTLHTNVLCCCWILGYKYNMHSSMKEFEGQAWCSGESCLTESLGHGFEAASPQILQRGGLPRFFPSLDPNHVGASSTRSAPFMKEFQTTRRNQEYRTAIKCSPLSLNRTGSHSGAPSWQIGQCQAPRSPKNLPDPHVCTIQGPTKNQQREDALGNPPLPNWSPVASLHYHQDCSSSPS